MARGTFKHLGALLHHAVLRNALSQSALIELSLSACFSPKLQPSILESASTDRKRVAVEVLDIFKLLAVC